MNQTKDLILETALDLFNSRGLANVKLRTIAKTMGISQGNLSYHFRKRDDIIEALYFQLIDRINQHMMADLSAENIIGVLFKMSKSLMKDLYAYRFIILDFVQIMRNNQIIKDHFGELRTLRDLQFKTFFEEMVENGLMRGEVLDNEYKYLSMRMQLIGSYWLAMAETDQPPVGEDAVESHAMMINQSIYPYLTAKGRIAYEIALSG